MKDEPQNNKRTRLLATARGAKLVLDSVGFPSADLAGICGHCTGRLQTVTNLSFMVLATSTRVNMQLFPVAGGADTKNTELRSVPPIPTKQGAREARECEDVEDGVVHKIVLKQCVTRGAHLRHKVILWLHTIDRV